MYIAQTEIWKRKGKDDRVRWVVTAQLKDERTDEEVAGSFQWNMLIFAKNNGETPTKETRDQSKLEPRMRRM